MMQVLEQTSSIQILLALNKRPLTQKDLKKRVDATLVSISSSLLKLKEIGLIEEKLEEKFPRRKMITLTEKGKIVAEKLEDIELVIRLMN